MKLDPNITVSQLIYELEQLPPDYVVQFLDPDTDWALPSLYLLQGSEDYNRHTIYITGDYADVEDGRTPYHTNDVDKRS